MNALHSDWLAIDMDQNISELPYIIVFEILCVVGLECSYIHAQSQIQFSEHNDIFSILYWGFFLVVAAKARIKFVGIEAEFMHRRRWIIFEIHCKHRPLSFDLCLFYGTTHTHSSKATQGKLRVYGQIKPIKSYGRA